MKTTKTYRTYENRGVATSLEQIWAQAWKDVMEDRAQKQRAIDAMLRAGGFEPKREGKAS